MKSFISNNDGIAYGYSMMILALLFSSILWIALSAPVNEITEDTNEAVTDGRISEQTAHQYDWANRVFKYILPIGILMIIGSWGLTRANRSE